MTCSCEFSGWLRQALAGYGMSGLLVAFSVGLLLLAARKMRRESFKEPWRRALLSNAPALAMLLLGMAAGFTFLLGMLR